MVKDDGRIDFVTGAMVIQGATDTICKRIDRLHDETLAAVGNLTLDENDTGDGGDNESGTKVNLKVKFDPNPHRKIIENQKQA